MKIKMPWAKREENRVKSLRDVRFDKRVDLPGFYLYGDIEENKRKAAALRAQAQKEQDG